MATEWFCRIMGEAWGPMSARELIAIARHGRLTRDDVVRRGATGTWVRAEIVEGLCNTPAPAATATSHRMAIARPKATPGRRSVGKVRVTRYWVHDGQRKSGPFSSHRIRQLAAAGRLKPHDLVRSDRSHWVRAARIKGLEFGVAATQTKTVISAPTAPSDRPTSPLLGGQPGDGTYAGVGCQVVCEAGR